MLAKDLQQFGLCKNETAVYLALIELGKAKAGELIVKTGLHRNIVYTELEKLLHKRLVAQTSTRGVAVYKALDPSRLLDELHSKEALANSIIEELRLLHTPVAQEIVVYEGKEEIKRKELEIYRARKKGEVVRILGLSPQWHDVIGIGLGQKLMNVQVERGFYVRALGSTLGEDEKSYLEYTKGLSVFKILPPLSGTVSETTILDDRVVMKMFVEPYSMVEIRNPLLAKSYQEYFDTLWKHEYHSI